MATTFSHSSKSPSYLPSLAYLGKPYLDDDIVFFLIEDNAVYLSQEHNKRFGIFTGKESFEGDLELLNGQGSVLLETTGNFKRWER